MSVRATQSEAEMAWSHQLGFTRAEIAKEQGINEGQVGAALTRLGLVPAAPPVDPCPECIQDKHRNCDGTSWDVAQDQPAPCPCYTNDHH